MDTLTIVLWLLIGLVTCFYLLCKKRFEYWKNRGIPYLEPLTIPLGNLPFSRHMEFKDISQKFYDNKNGNPFLGGFLFTKPILMATDLDFVQNVLVKDFSSFHERGMYVNEVDDPLSAHMFAVDGEKWKSLRAKLSPTFTSGRMKLMFPTVVEVAARFNEVLMEMVSPSATLEMKELLSRFTTDVIGTCAFGIECNSLRTPNSDFRTYGSKLFDDPLLPPLAQLLCLEFPNLARKLHIRFLQKDVINFFLNLVRETIAMREDKQIRRNDFMDLLIQLKNGNSLDEHSKALGQMTLEEIAAQAFLFFLAGFETSSTTMMFALYELTINPDIQDKVRKEINEVLAKHDGNLTYESVKDMVYIDRTISETLRKYPPVTGLNRQCAKDYRVPDTNLTIEKGTAILIPVYSFHHDPKIYPDPEKFDPDRFTPEQIQARHSVAFLGFGDGPRNCVGLRFGRMQSRIGLITLVKNFRFKPSDKTMIPLKFVENASILSPKNGMPLLVERI